MDGGKYSYIVYKKIISDLEFIQEVISNMRKNTYVSLDTYLNNLKIVADFYKKIESWMKNKEFVSFFKQKDPGKYIQVMSTGQSIVLMTNLLANIENDLKSQQQMKSQHNQLIENNKK